VIIFTFEEKNEWSESIVESDDSRIRIRESVSLKNLTTIDPSLVFLCNQVFVNSPLFLKKKKRFFRNVSEFSVPKFFQQLHDNKYVRIG
jgi:hypothetical protein